MPTIESLEQRIAALESLVAILQQRTEAAGEILANVPKTDLQDVVTEIQRGGITLTGAD
jgi:hypothetical protein